MATRQRRRNTENIRADDSIVALAKPSFLNNPAQQRRDDYAV